MFPTLPLTCILVTLATIQTSQGHAGVHTREVMYHSSVNFTCNSPLGHEIDLSVFPASMVRRLWILPNNHIIDTGKPTEPDEHVDILDKGATLQVKNVEDEDFGWYHCVIQMVAGDSFLMQKYGLNVNGPYWGDLYDLKYKSMVTTGLVAGAICLVSMGLLCFLYGKQQTKLDKLAEDQKASRQKEDDDLAGEASAPHKPVTAFNNPAYVTDSSESLQKPAMQQSWVEEESGGKKGPAPRPPAEQELQNVVAADGAAAANGDERANSSVAENTRV